MNPLAKGIRANERRVTRFHTERGQLMPWAAWLRLPGALWARAISRTGDTPWMVPAAVSYLAHVMRPDWNVFEFGSGSSTVWYAARSGRVTSVEHDPRWYDLVRQRLDERVTGNCDLRLVDLKAFPKCMEGCEDDTFDLVIVDGSEEGEGDRLSCVASSAPKVKQGGYLVLDDCDQAAYRGADALLVRWAVRRFVGVKPYPLMAVETSIYQRPLNPRGSRGRV